MDTDLSFIEISAEDEDDASLLLLQQHQHFIDPRSVFSCSPLQISRSNAPSQSSPIPTESPAAKEETETASCSYRVDSGNKENSTANKSELPKLSLEPNKMKRKKKGGECNLRKSLAWNRAFFTEEGVLDPIELSMIIGNFGKSSGELLSGIKEDETELPFGRLDCNSRNSSRLQTPEENLLKGLPGRTPRKEKKIDGSLFPERTPRKEKKIDCGSLPKSNSSARANIAPSPSVKRKVFSPHDANKSGSKRSSSQPPMASSSQKSLGGASATKATIKETKVSKIPVPKQDPRLLSTNAKTVKRGLSYSMHKPISEPASMQKSSNPKVFPKNAQTQNNAKVDPDSRLLMAKSSIPKPRRNTATSPLEVPLPTNLQHPVVTEAKSTLKMIHDSIVPPLEVPLPTNLQHPVVTEVKSTLIKMIYNSIIPTKYQASTVCAGESSKSVASLPHNVNHVSGNHQTQLPVSKPSGLRMPSPSLGFFGQSKASASLRTGQPCSLPEHSISTMQKPGALISGSGLRPPRPPSKIPAINNMKLPSLSSGCPVSTTIPSSNENVKYNFEESNIQKVEAKVSSDLNGQKMSKTIAKQQQLLNIPCDFDSHSLERGEVHKTETLISENSELQKHGSKLVSRSEQLEKETDIEVADVSRKSQDLGGADFENAQTVQLSSKVQVKVPVSESRDTGITVHDDNGKSQGQRGLLITCIAETDGNFNGSQGLQMENGILSKEDGSSEDLQKHNTGDIVDVSLKAIEVDNCDVIFDKYAIQEKDFVLGDEDMNKKQHDSDALVQSLNGNVAVEKGCSFPTTSSVHNDIMVVDDKDNFEGQAEHSPIHLEEDQGSENSYRSHSRDYLLKGERFSSEESQKQNALQTVISVTSEGCGSYVSKVKSSTALCHVQPSLVDCGSDDAESMKCQLAEDVHAGIDESKSGAEIEHLHLTLQHNPAVQVVGGLELSHIVGQVDAQEQYSLSVEEQVVISDFHPGEKIMCCNQVSLGVHSDELSSVCDVTGLSIEQSHMKNICYSECDKIYLEESQSDQMCRDLLFSRSSCFEESQVSDNGRDADVNPNGEGFGGNEFQSSYGLVDHTNTDQGNKGSSEVDSKVKEFLSGDGPVQCRNYNLLAGSSCSNLSPSAMRDQYALVVDDVNGECGEHPHIEYTSHINKVSQDNQMLSLSKQLSLEDSISRESEVRNVVGTICQATTECHSPSTSLTPLAPEDFSSTGEIQEKLDKSTCPIQDKDVAVSLTKSDGSDKKQRALTITPPPYAAPFSDEWLAAFEAAGEEILAMKSGAVQNSPPDKAPAEPGPYSPVRRKKNQSIGPYDCTKYTNVGPSSPH